MHNTQRLDFVLTLLFGFSVLNCFSISTQEKEYQNKLSLDADEIVFYSNGSNFSPVIVLQADAIVTWTWADSTTSNSTTPTKEYGSDLLRGNRLKVTPWSAVRRINIGYDALDGGSSDIELVADQKVSLVENIGLVAPYLKEWCSSHSSLISLDFSNFINIETIECFKSLLLKNLQLTNTPKLKRLCLEDNDVIDLDLQDCNSLEDIRGALNNFTNINFPTHSENIWHICVWDNQFTNQHLFNDFTQFPMIAQAWIANTNQQGEFIMPKSNPTYYVSIWGWDNKYSSLDLRGAYQNNEATGFVSFSNNELIKVNIKGCIQINELYLNNNKLDSLTIDQILHEVDEYRTNNGIIDLTFNMPPTSIGLFYKANLERRGWVVNIEPNIPIDSVRISSAGGTTISTENGSLQLVANVLPENATSKVVNWSVINDTGKASISSTGLLTAEKNGTVTVYAAARNGLSVYGNLSISISGQKILVENISIIDNLQKDTIFGIDTTISLTASIFPENAYNQVIDWTVENITGEADIDINGNLNTSSIGLIKVTAMATDGSNVNGQKEYIIAIPTSVHNIVDLYQFNIIPNSSNGTIQLHLNKKPLEGVVVEIRNILGEKLIEQNIFNNFTTLSINKSSTSIYFVTLKSKNWINTKKLIF